MCQALRTDSDLRHRLGLRQQEVEPTLHGWIVDTCIEHDHENFSGYLKVSLEELLVVLRNERHLLLGMAGEPEEADLYPDGFSGGRFAAIVENNELWSMLTSTGHEGNPAPATGV